MGRCSGAAAGLRFAAGLRRATVFFFFAAFFFPTRRYAFAIDSSSRLPARRRFRA